MYEILVPELRDDPLGRGYAAMTPQQVIDDLNTAYRTTTRPVTARQIVRWSSAWDSLYSPSQRQHQHRDICGWKTSRGIS